MSEPRWTVVIHGAAPPGPAAKPDWRDVIAPALRGPFAWHEVFGHDAAARLADLARQADSDFLLLIAAHGLDPSSRLHDLISSVEARGGLALLGPPNALESWVRVAASGDLLTTLAGALHDSVEGRESFPLPAVAAVAASRQTFLSLGGFDHRVWPVGEAIDLALRALQTGVAVEVVGDETPAWPTQAHSLLAWRNAVLIAASQPDPDTAGPLLAWVATLAIAASWRATGLEAAALRFGGEWAHQGRVDRWLGRTGVTRNEKFWPRDEVGTLVPLLGIDAALDTLATGRAGQPGAAESAALPVPPDGGPSGTPDGGAEPPGLAASDEAASPATAAAPAAGVRGEGRLPLVSVVVVNWNGEAHLETCFASLLASTYPRDRLELICVDNGSTDGSKALLAARFPQVRLVALDENRGFTGGNNAGVAAARGDVLAFFNNDMRVEPEALSRLVAALDERHPCVAARVLSWDGRRLDFVGGSVSFEARGFQDHHGEPVRPELSAAGETFFPNGGAFVITREMYLRAGGFDDRFFAYYDDIDLGWGVRLAGGHVRVVPDAVVHHRHGATSRRQPRGQKQFLMQRNAVWTAVKRYGEPALRRTLGPILLLAIRRIVQDSTFDTSAPAARALAPLTARLASRWRSRQGSGPVTAADSSEPGLLRRFPLESLAALGAAVEAFPELAVERRRIQVARRVADDEILPRFGRALECLSSRASYKRVHEWLVARLGLDRLLRQRSRVLIVTHEPLRANLSGPGVRALELGRALSDRCRVTLATPYPPELDAAWGRLVQYDFGSQASMAALAEDADVIVVQGFTLARFPLLTRLPAAIVVDLYCPFTIEHLEMRTSGALASAPGAMSIQAIDEEAQPVLSAQNEQLRVGDFFLCASERQRDFWLGALQTAGRINARTYAADPTLRSLIDVVAFGVPDQPPPAHPGAIKGVMPGIGPQDRVVLWAGSILDWQDPQGLVRAMARLAATRSDIKLVFMGARHPNPDVPRMRAVEESIGLARSLGLLDTYVFFNPWVPYAERHAWLLDADVGVSTHGDHLETRLSFRTRMLDYLWAGLPIVCTQGDVFAELVERHKLGLTVAPGDEAGLAAALERLASDGELRAQCAQRVRALADQLRWSQVTQPLQRFCLAPTHAADREPGIRAIRARLDRKYRVSKWLKRTALRLGVSEGLIESVKQAEPVRTLLIWRNKVALARAQRGR